MSNKKLKPNKKKSFIDLFKFRINKKKSFMDLFNLFLEHKKLFIFGFATLLVYVIISCLAPVFVNMIVHNFTKLPDSYGNIVYTCIVIICLYLLSFSSFAVCNFIYSFIDVKVATTLRNKIINKFPRLPLKYFDKTKIGDTLNIAVNATNDITDNLSTSLVSLIQGAIFLVGILTAMFILSWQLAFACLIALPIGFVCMSIFMKMGEKYYKQRVATLGKVNANVEESFTGIQVTELYNLKKVKAISFAKDNKNLRNANKYSTFFGSVHMSIFAFVANLGYTIVCLTCALLALDAKDPEK
jgi:ATP-binding cassette subfamily B protein